MNRKQLIQLVATVGAVVALYFLTLPPFVAIAIKVFGDDASRKKFEWLTVPIEWFGDKVPGFKAVYYPYVTFWFKVIGD